MTERFFRQITAKENLASNIDKAFLDQDWTFGLAGIDYAPLNVKTYMKDILLEKVSFENRNLKLLVAQTPFEERAYVNEVAEVLEDRQHGVQCQQQCRPRAVGVDRHRRAEHRLGMHDGFEFAEVTAGDHLVPGLERLGDGGVDLGGQWGHGRFPVGWSEFGRLAHRAEASVVPW